MTSAAALAGADVDVLVLTYRPSLEHGLGPCVASLLVHGDGAHIVVAVNDAEARAAATIDALAVDWPADRVDVVYLGRNWGYAEGINRGLDHCHHSLVLLLNDDAIVCPGCVEQLSTTLRCSSRDVVGVAPKTLLAEPAGVIDNVGAATRRSGWIYNRGAGEIDIGQYSRCEPVAGLCFAAALLRREAFTSSQVGLLEASYFMYGEDAEWCLRARARGLNFRADPKALVIHRHSLSSGLQAAETKAWLIRRNTTLTVAAIFPVTKALPFVLTRVVEQAGAFLIGDLPRKRRALRRLADLCRHLPRTAVRRKTLRPMARQTGDEAVFRYTDDCSAHLQVTLSGRLEPRPARSTLDAMYRRRGGPNDALVVDLLHSEPTARLATTVGPRLATDGPAVRALLDRIVDAESLALSATGFSDWEGGCGVTERRRWSRRRPRHAAEGDQAIGGLLLPSDTPQATTDPSRRAPRGSIG